MALEGNAFETWALEPCFKNNFITNLSSLPNQRGRVRRLNTLPRKYQEEKNKHIQKSLFLFIYLEDL